MLNRYQEIVQVSYTTYMISLFFYRSVSFTAILPIYCDKVRIDRYTEYKQFSKCKEV